MSPIRLDKNINEHMPAAYVFTYILTILPVSSGNHEVIVESEVDKYLRFLSSSNSGLPKHEILENADMMHSGELCQKFGLQLPNIGFDWWHHEWYSSFFRRPTSPIARIIDRVPKATLTFNRSLCSTK